MLFSDHLFLHAAEALDQDGTAPWWSWPARLQKECWAIGKLFCTLVGRDESGSAVPCAMRKEEENVPILSHS